MIAAPTNEIAIGMKMSDLEHRLALHPVEQQGEREAEARWTTIGVDDDPQHRVDEELAVVRGGEDPRVVVQARRHFLPLASLKLQQEGLDRRDHQADETAAGSRGRGRSVVASGRLQLALGLAGEEEDQEQHAEEHQDHADHQGQLSGCGHLFDHPPRLGRDDERTGPGPSRTAESEAGARESVYTLPDPGARSLRH